MRPWTPDRNAVFVAACEESRTWPQPGQGATAERWRCLSNIAKADLVVGRLVEAHADAGAILNELGGPPTEPGSRWGVWAAGPAGAVEAEGSGNRWWLDGIRPWCSGATLLTHALVTATFQNDPRLFAVDLRHPTVRPEPETWVGPGMQASDTRSVGFRGTPAIPLGGPRSYLDRPGFWIGAMGVAACWHGGTTAVGERLLAAARRQPTPHLLAQLGAVGSLAAQSGAALAAAALEVDADPKRDHEVLAIITRTAVEASAREIIDRTARALGPGPLAHEAEHSALVANLTVYLRQHHGDADLERLGTLLADRKDEM